MNKAKIHIDGINVKSVHIGNDPVKLIALNGLIKIFKVDTPVAALRNANNEVVCFAIDDKTESFDLYIDNRYIGTYDVEEGD